MVLHLNANQEMVGWNRAISKSIRFLAAVVWAGFSSIPPAVLQMSLMLDIPP
jgi:hypothetical protein